MVVLGMGFPGGSDGKESTCDAGDPGSPLGREDPLEKGMAIFILFCLHPYVWSVLGGSLHGWLQLLEPDLL